MKYLIALLLGFFVMSAHAATFHVRDDDAGHVTHSVPEINVSKIVNFDEVSGPYPERWAAFTTTDQGDSWAPIFAGQTLSCEYYDPSTNPPRNANTERLRKRYREDENEMMPSGKIHDAPTSPLTVFQRPTAPLPENIQEGRTTTYQSYQYPYGPGGSHGMGSGSWADHASQGCGNSGDDPWSYKFQTAVTAFCAKMSLGPTNVRTEECFTSDRPIGGFSTWLQTGSVTTPDGEVLGPRLHMEFWSDTGAVVEKIGHMDILVSASHHIWWEVSSGTPIDEPEPPPEPITTEEQVEENRVNIEEIQQILGIE